MLDGLKGAAFAALGEMPGVLLFGPFGERREGALGVKLGTVDTERLLGLTGGEGQQGIHLDHSTGRD